MKRPKVTDEVAALRAADQEVRDAFGELTMLAEGEVPEVVESFASLPDGERWRRVFAHFTWIAVEADGGAIGYWRRVDPPVVAYVDNEGSFHLTGRTLAEHFAWKDFANRDAALLASFCAQAGLAPPGAKAEREAALARLETPEQRFAALAKDDPASVK